MSKMNRLMIKVTRVFQVVRNLTLQINHRRKKQLKLIQLQHGNQSSNVKLKLKAMKVCRGWRPRSCSEMC